MTDEQRRRTAYDSMLRVRAARRFRQQLWSPRHPERRIHRVYNCANWRSCGGKDVPTEGHHINYRRPFCVVWVCTSCHRRIETGSLRVKARWVHDYSSLVFQNPGRHHHGENLAPQKTEETPF